MLKKAFTILELIIVITLLSILIAIMSYTLYINPKKEKTWEAVSLLLNTASLIELYYSKYHTFPSSINNLTLVGVQNINKYKDIILNCNLTNLSCDLILNTTKDFVPCDDFIVNNFINSRLPSNINLTCIGQNYKMNLKITPLDININIY